MHQKSRLFAEVELLQEKPNGTGGLGDVSKAVAPGEVGTTICHLQGPLHPKQKRFLKDASHRGRKIKLQCLFSLYNP